jgi:hypothetical protein
VPSPPPVSSPRPSFISLTAESGNALVLSAAFLPMAAALVTVGLRLGAGTREHVAASQLVAA